MAARKLDIQGLRFGRLVALEEAGRKHRAAVWRLRCDCGNEVLREARDLRTSRTPSCGCASGRALRAYPGASRTPDEREATFWSHVDMSGGPHACWPWMGSRRAKGYGSFGYQIGGTHFTHIASRFALSVAQPAPNDQACAPSARRTEACDGQL